MSTQSAAPDLSYPIGKFQYSGSSTPADRQRFIEEIAAAPARLRDAIRGLDEQQLNTPYRPGGWTVRQVVHHLPDSHLNAYVRFKLALTEDEPLIKPYEEARWAETPDVHATPLDTSLTLLDSLHARWVTLLRAMSDSDFHRKLRHPQMGVLELDRMLAMYAWHGRHHVAHIAGLRQRNAW